MAIPGEGVRCRPGGWGGREKGPPAAEATLGAQPQAEGSPARLRHPQRAGGGHGKEQGRSWSAGGRVAPDPELWPPRGLLSPLLPRAEDARGATLQTLAEKML